MEDIRTTIINIYDEAIQSAQAINIERNVVDKIFWKGNSLLESVGLLEPEICKTRKDIEALVNASLRPLLAYAREYDQFIEFHTLKIEGTVHQKYLVIRR